MAQNCSICIHSDSVLINKALVAKTPLRHIALQFGTSTGAHSSMKVDSGGGRPIEVWEAIK